MADEDARNTEALFDLAEVNRIESEMRENLGDTKTAVKYIETVPGLFEKKRRADGKNMESRSTISAAHKKLAELYKKENQPDRALFYKRELEKIKKESPQNSAKS